MAVCGRGRTAVILLALLSIFPEEAGLARKVFADGPAGACPWAGIYPTVLTPFRCTGGIDVPSLECQLRHELHGGVHGLLVLGTLGEGVYATMDERAQVIATAVRMACPAVPVVVGIHTCDVDWARAQMLQAKQLGAAAVLVKYLGNPDACADEVLGFYTALSAANLLPIFYYHYPSQTGLHLHAHDIVRILSLPGVVGIKESTFNLREVQTQMALACGLGKVFLSASALNLTQFLELGGHGGMCPEAVLLPGQVVRAYGAYVQGRHGEARALQGHFFAMTPILRSAPTPPAVARFMLMATSDHKLPVRMSNDQPQARLKLALACLGVPTPTAVKCPLPPLTRKDQKRVAGAMRRVQEIDGCAEALAVPPQAVHPGQQRTGRGSDREMEGP